MIALQQPRRNRPSKKPRCRPRLEPSDEVSSPLIEHPRLQAALERIGALTIEFVGHGSFAQSEPEQEAVRVLQAIEPSLAPGSGEEPQLLSAADETKLFQQMNWFKYWADRWRKRFLNSPTDTLAVRIDTLVSAATKLRNQLIQCNLRLVPFVARNFVSPHNSLSDLISDGHMTLIRSVERFDFSRGFRFSTYATWALRFTLARNVADARRRRGRFANLEQATDAAGPELDTSALSEGAYPSLKRTIASLLSRLDPREQEIVRARFGIARLDEEETLKQIARRMGVCKERVRQLEIRAIAKLHKLAAQHGIQLDSWSNGETSFPLQL